MIEAISMIGAILFAASAPVGFGIGMYNSKHPEAEKKMHAVFERHKNLSTFCLLVYVIWAELGILHRIASM